MRAWAGAVRDVAGAGRAWAGAVARREGKFLTGIPLPDHVRCVAALAHDRADASHVARHTRKAGDRVCGVPARHVSVQDIDVDWQAPALQGGARRAAVLVHTVGEIVGRVGGAHAG